MVLAVLVLASISFGYTNLQYCDSGDTFTGRTYSVPAATRFYLMDNWPRVGGIESAYLKKIWFRFSAPGQLTYEVWDGNILGPIGDDPIVVPTTISVSANTWQSFTISSLHEFEDTIWVIFTLANGLQISYDSNGNFTGSPRSVYLYTWPNMWSQENNDFAMKIEVDIIALSLDRATWGSIKASF
jgi:hypothetical protein